MLATQTYIRRVIVRGGAPDRLRQRLRLKRLLESLDLKPPGMPPAARLFVRRLPDPLPGNLASHPGALRPSPEWEAAVRGLLSEAYRQAARPQRGQLPAGAEAVCFADEAELLACLALDLRVGRAAERWWWQTLLSDLPGTGGQALASLFLQGPPLLPGAFQYLSAWGQAWAVAQALAPDSARAISIKMAESYRLSGVIAVLAGGTRGDAPPPAGGKIRSGFARQIPSVPAPWRLWLADDPSDLGAEQACLLGISLGLVRHARLVQSHAFAADLQSWRQAHAAPGAGGSPEMEKSSNEAGSPSSGAVATPPGVATDGFPQAVTEGEPMVQDRPLPLLPGAGGMTSPVELAEPLTPAAGKAAVSASASLPEGFPTRLGGVMYLTNVMYHLDLPDCFEASWGLASQVGAWGVLELLARALLGDRHANLVDDPLWALLAELDGRPADTLPGADFSAPPGDDLPAGWSLPRSGATIGARGLPPAGWLRGVNPGLLRWLEIAMPFIDWRLRQALQLGEEADLAERLLLVAGRLYVTPTHIDLFVSIDSVSLPVRLAGLDFDPGWQPRFGRVVQFHFD